MYFLVVTHLFAACDSDDLTTETSASQNALSVQVPKNTMEAHQENTDDDGPSLPVSTKWVELESRKTVKTDALYLEVTNRSNSDFILRARLNCYGFMTMNASFDIEATPLLAGETTIVQYL